MISKKQLFELERIAKLATHGPWYLCGEEICTKKPKSSPDECKYDCGEYMVYEPENLTFIAAFNPSVALLLINHIQMLEAQVRELKHGK